jgi:Flp pilus assembly protein TadD
MKQRTSGPLLMLIFVCLSALGQTSWEAPIDAGKNAMARRQYGEAEKSFREALTVAQKFGEKDARFAGSLMFLAQACDAQAKTDEAEALAGRAVESMNKAPQGLQAQKGRTTV